MTSYHSPAPDNEVRKAVEAAYFDDHETGFVFSGLQDRDLVLCRTVERAPFAPRDCRR